MSQWTHVNASFRLDSIGYIPDERIEEVFGKEISYDDLYDYDETSTVKTLPMGSEGSLNISVWHNPDRCCMASTTVTVFGDLRDYGGDSDIEKLKEWFNNCCNEFMVRQAIMQIQDEWQKDTIVVEYKGK